MRTVLKTAGSAVLLLVSGSVFSADFLYGGFASLYAGKILDGEGSEFFATDLNEADCPCFITDYPDASYYTDDGIQFGPDSGYGLQGGIRFNDRFSLTGQIEGQEGSDFQPELTWLYLRTQVNENLIIDVGRKGIPLFFYSDFLNVGYALPWVRVPGDIYGWPLTSYNGISATYSALLGEGSYRIGAWYGSERDTDSRAYADIYWGSENFTIAWDDMLGLSFEYDHDWLVFRAVTMQSDNDEKVYWDDGTSELIADDEKQFFYGVALLIDYNNIIFQAEYNHFRIHEPNTHHDDDFTSRARFFSAGYRLGEFTYLISYSKYTDYEVNFGRQINSTTSMTIRWDFADKMAFKVQLDSLDDQTEWPDYTDGRFTGDATVIAMGVDYVF